MISFSEVILLNRDLHCYFEEWHFLLIKSGHFFQKAFTSLIFYHKDMLQLSYKIYISKNERKWFFVFFSLKTQNLDIKIELEIKQNIYMIYFSFDVWNSWKLFSLFHQQFELVSTFCCLMRFDYCIFWSCNWLPVTWVFSLVQLKFYFEFEILAFMMCIVKIEKVKKYRSTSEFLQIFFSLPVLSEVLRWICTIII